MRSRSKMVFAALVAVVAISAVAASSAFASPEWYVKKAKVFAKVTSSVNVHGTDTWEFVETKYEKKVGIPATLSISCTGEGEGTIKAGGDGTISHLGESSCKPGKTSGNQCKESVKVAGVDLPWKTELYKEGSTIRDRIVSGGDGTPGMELVCKTGLFGEFTAFCSINTNTLMTNNVSGGLVEAELEKVSNKTHCSFSEEESGEWKGTLKVTPDETGVEAIKVE
jgi:hypothetical protein